MMRFLGEIVRLAVLAWTYRSYKSCRVSSYARVSLRASKLADELRGRYPGKNFVWSLSTNHTLNSGCEYICMWQGGSTGGLQFVFHGPIDFMVSKVEEGYFDPKFLPEGRPTG